MNTIKFTPIDDMKKETNNVECYEIKEIELSGQKYKYYSNAQMSVYITKKCNASCWFCMNNYEKRFCNSKEIADEDYFKNLERVLDAFKDEKVPITITGGEPTKSKRLIKVMQLLHQKGFKSRTFATNGTGLLDRYEGKMVINYLLDNGIVNNINVSRMVTSDVENEKLMHIKQKNVALQKIFNYGKVNGMDMRLSCNLQKGGVDNLDEILKFIDFYEKRGINTVMFRELIPLQDYQYQKRMVKIEDIFKEIEKNKDFIFLRKMEGMYYTVKVYRYKEKLVKCYLEKRSEALKDVIREFVFYSDGNLDGGWNKENNIVLERR